MSLLTDRLFEKYYFARPGFVNGTARLHELCRAHINKGAQILEIGSGPSNSTSEFLANIGAVTGLDISDEVRHNASLEAAYTFDGKIFPFESDRFDACVSNFVLEHVEDPDLHFAEVARVLRPGGVYCFRTPNQWHYVGLVSSMLPHGLHLALANKLRAIPEAHDPYPTFYRANTRSKLSQLRETAGLQAAMLQAIEPEPSYGRISPLLFFPMMSYERVVNAVPGLERLRASFLAVFRKPGAASQNGVRVAESAAAKH